MTAAMLWGSDEADVATGGCSSAPWQASGVSIDSRSTGRGELFVALSGPNHDGHAFVEAAFDSGASAAVVSSPLGIDRPQLVVSDTHDALFRLAEAARRRGSARVAAVTGSVGKTGVKEGLAHVLGSQGPTCASPRSFNNSWGVPLSLARMPRDAAFGVFEVGMNAAGEVGPLSQLVRPDVAVVTTIAPAHMAFFDSLEDIARAKAEIFSGLDGGAAVINLDTPFHELLVAEARASGAGRVIGFGEAAEAELRLLGCDPGAEGIGVRASWRGESLEFRVPFRARHWAHNALALLATVHALGADLETAAAGLATLPALDGRGRVHTLPWREGEITLVDDSYNANPVSMRSALETLGGITPAGGRRVAVLGDMLELGESSRDAHAGLASAVVDHKIDRVHLVGPEMRALAEALDRRLVGLAAADVDKILADLVADLRAGDVVTVKASNGIGLSRVVAAVLERAGGAGRPSNGEAPDRAL